MQISKNKVVSLSFELRLDSAEGDVIEQASEEAPLTFLYGAGNMLPGFEQSLEGFQEGQEFDFSLSKDQAYGDKNDEAVMDLPKNIFEVEGKIDENVVKVGNVIPMRDPDGNEYQGIVRDIADDTVKMDFNHPLAGYGLHFSGKILNLREATEDEVSNGEANTEE